jgi:hypothetical protein
MIKTKGLGAYCVVIPRIILRRAQDDNAPCESETPLRGSIQYKLWKAGAGIIENKKFVNIKGDIIHNR